MARSGAYELEALMKVRQRALDEAQEVLAEALERTNQVRQKLTSAQETLNRRRREQQAIEDYRRNQAGRRTLTPADLQMSRAQADALVRGVTEAAAAVSVCVKQLETELEKEEKARQGLYDARKELEVIEKHKAKWAAQRAAKREAAEEDEAEEIAQAQYWRGQRGSSD
ncbi:MAG: YscO family type III secretion system apparatus protein [Deltaproteobacteria bacterium]|nr:YscO family type III secretion system apparatus protein [Deltaproteobacteria bacterium]